MPRIEQLSVPASYLAVFLDGLLADERARGRVIELAGLDERSLRAAGATLPLNQVLATLRLLDSQAPPGWHIEPTLNLEATHHGPLGVAVMTAATLGEALDALVRFESIRAPWTVLTARRDAGQIHLEALPAIALPPPGPLLMEMNLIALTGMVGRLLGRHTDELVVSFPARYRPWNQKLQTLLPGRVLFEGTRYGLALPESRLAQPCLLADPDLHNSAVERCQSLLTHPAGQGPLAAEIRRQLVAAQGQAPGLTVMARRLNQSPRSLIRHLDRHGTGYRQLVDEVRQTLARDWLQHSDLSVASIADRLGYSDPANFGRAFKRWFGVSPGQARRRGRQA